MYSRGLVVVLLLSPVLIFGQLSNNAVTVTASQTASATADQAVFTLSVRSGPGQSLDTVVGALAGIGITAANLVGFSAPTTEIAAGPGQPGTALVWTFELTAPLAKIKDTLATLTTLQQTIQQGQSGLSLSFSLTGTRVSAAAACNAAGLLPTARTQAQAIASAAGLNAGVLLAMTTASGSPVCTLTARFALGPLFGPTDPHAITVTATRSASLQPDQALIALTISSRLTSTEDDVNAALSQAGITGATFAGVTSTKLVVLPIGVGAAVQPLLEWSYTLAAPIAKISNTITLLLAAQQSFAKSNAGFSLTFYVEGLQVSQALQNSQTCSESGLLSDANATAQTLAAAAGVAVGPILSMAAPATVGIASAVYAADSFQFISASNSVGLASFLLTSALPAPSANNCSLAVQYQMMP